MRLSKKTLVEFVEVCIDSFVSIIECRVPGKWMVDSKENEENFAKERKDANIDKIEFAHLVDTHLWHLGWNLSILYARATNDGMAEQDALAIAQLEDVLTNWAEDWWNGEVGYVPSKGKPYTGTVQHPDTKTLATSWIEEVVR